MVLKVALCFLCVFICLIVCQYAHTSVNGGVGLKCPPHYCKTHSEITALKLSSSPSPANRGLPSAWDAANTPGGAGATSQGEEGIKPSRTADRFKFQVASWKGDS